MATGHFYLNSGSGGPSLTNAAGSLIAVLDWMLDVAGGTNWQKVFSKTNVAVYRSTTGQRFYLRVDDTVGQIARLRMYQTMTDVDTGTFSSPNGSPQSTSYCTMIKTDQASAATWYAVGDQRFFFMMSMHDNIGSYRYFAPMAFGEFNSYDPLDSYNTILLGSHYTSNSAAYNQYKRNFLTSGSTMFAIQSTSYVPTADNPNTFCIASPDGLIQSSASMIHDPWGIMNSSQKGTGGVCHFGSAPALVYQPFYIIDSNGAGGSFQNMFAYYGSNAYVRGTLPYVYSTPYAGKTGATHGGQVLNGAEEFRTIEYGWQYDSQAGNDENTRILMLRESNDEPGRTF